MVSKYKNWVIFVLLIFHLLELKCEETNCSFSLKKQILTCENIQLKHANIEHLLTNSTQVLILKNCENLKIGPGLHTKHFENLTSYQIIGTKCLDISPFTYQKLIKLKYLKICDNNLPLIRNNTFYGPSELQILNLNNNSIQQIEVDAFNRLTDLETLELTHNAFKVVPSKLFATLKNLKSLFLYHNNIEILEDNCLHGLNNLNVLDLTYNRITKINTEMFNNLKQISHLYLSFNQIEIIEGDFISTTLEFLYLQNNKLKTVSSSMFNKLSNLLDLDLSRNKISFLAPDAFSNLTKLTNLNYKDNSLASPVKLEFNKSKPFVTS